MDERAGAAERKAQARDFLSDSKPNESSAGKLLHFLSELERLDRTTTSFERSELNFPAKFFQSFRAAAPNRSRIRYER